MLPTQSQASPIPSQATFIYQPAHPPHATLYTSPCYPCPNTRQTQTHKGIMCVNDKKDARCRIYCSRTPMRWKFESIFASRLCSRQGHSYPAPIRILCGNILIPPYSRWKFLGVWRVPRGSASRLPQFRHWPSDLEHRPSHSPNGRERERERERRSGRRVVKSRQTRWLDLSHAGSNEP